MNAATATTLADRDQTIASLRALLKAKDDEIADLTRDRNRFEGRLLLGKAPASTIYKYAYADQNEGVAPDAGTLAEALELSADLGVTITLLPSDDGCEGSCHPEVECSECGQSNADLFTLRTGY